MPRDESRAAQIGEKSRLHSLPGELSANAEIQKRLQASWPDW